MAPSNTNCPLCGRHLSIAPGSVNRCSREHCPFPRIGFIDPRITLYIKATHGTRIVDPEFDKLMQAADRDGHFAVPCHRVSDEPAFLQASHFARVAALRPGAAWALLTDNPYGAPPSETTVQEVRRALKLLTGREPEALGE